MSYQWIFLLFIIPLKIKFCGMPYRNVRPLLVLIVTKHIKLLQRIPMQLQVSTVNESFQNCNLQICAIFHLVLFWICTNYLLEFIELAEIMICALQDDVNKFPTFPLLWFSWNQSLRSHKINVMFALSDSKLFVE